ncbi:hypothetical protein EXIGLDRAFT_726568 [Exidia glandulosa HHB12029]|uniref:Uncharacterized protein n=1 Tax=Exidia glandulosa HHB12029 TaxID=1314781 RepID=A0A165ZQM6_EXIGL|nr:hypothetical protein EXIGLDRAFT_726568 [Exidia glandulosa HHB12029]
MSVGFRSIGPLARGCGSLQLQSLSVGHVLICSLCLPICACHTANPELYSVSPRPCVHNAPRYQVLAPATQLHVDVCCSHHNSALPPFLITMHSP